MIIWMILISIILHSIGTFVSVFTYMLPAKYSNNNIVYNLIAIIKPSLICFYLLTLKQMRQYYYLRILISLFIAFIPINFLFIENIFNFSISMVIAESVILLVFVLTFFLDAMIDDDIPTPIKHPAFFICSATGIFESINFLVYLFIFPVYNADYDFAILIMKISSFAFIIYGLIISLGIYYNRSTLRFSRRRTTYV